MKNILIIFFSFLCFSVNAQSIQIDTSEGFAYVHITPKLISAMDTIHATKLVVNGEDNNFWTTTIINYSLLSYDNIVLKSGTYILMYNDYALFLQDYHYIYQYIALQLNLTIEE